MVFVKGQPNPGFQPGQSGNPGGRAPVVREMRERCQKWVTEEGFDILIKIALGKGLPQDQLKAVTFLYDQGMGKAVQQLAGADDADFNKLKIIIQREAEPEPKGESNDDV